MSNRIVLIVIAACLGVLFVVPRGVFAEQPRPAQVPVAEQMTKLQDQITQLRQEIEVLRKALEASKQTPGEEGGMMEHMGGMGMPGTMPQMRGQCCMCCMPMMGGPCGMMH